MPKRRHYTAEFKTRVVLELLAGQKGLMQVIRDYEIKDTILSRWKQEFLERALQLFGREQADTNETDMRIAELERMVGKLTLELDLAKKLGVLQLDWEDKRRIVQMLIEEYAARPGIACRVLSLPRSSYYYCFQRKQENALKDAMNMLRPVKRLRIRTTDSEHGLPRFPHLMAGLEISYPNQVWLADITYIRLKHDFTIRRSSWMYSHVPFAVGISVGC